MLDGDWHQRRPNDDAEIIDQALKVREVAGALFDGLILRAGTGPATTEQN